MGSFFNTDVKCRIVYNSNWQNHKLVKCSGCPNKGLTQKGYKQSHLHFKILQGWRILPDCGRVPEEVLQNHRLTINLSNGQLSTEQKSEFLVF